MEKPKLLDQVRNLMRVRHLSHKTELGIQTGRQPEFPSFSSVTARINPFLQPLLDNKSLTKKHKSHCDFKFTVAFVKPFMRNYPAAFDKISCVVSNNPSCWKEPNDSTKTQSAPIF